MSKFLFKSTLNTKSNEPDDVTMVNPSCGGNFIDEVLTICFRLASHLYCDRIPTSEHALINGALATLTQFFLEIVGHLFNFRV